MRILHTIASFVLMVTVLLSSTGVRLSQHWCGENLVSASVFGEAQPCSHYKATEKPACPFHAAKEAPKKCCDQRETLIDGNDYDFEIQVTSAPVPDYAISWIQPVLYLVNHGNQEYTTPKYLNHSPPLIGSDILVRNQSLLL